MQKISDHISRGFVQVCYQLSGQRALVADSPSVLTTALADPLAGIIGVICVTNSLQISV